MQDILNFFGSIGDNINEFFDSISLMFQQLIEYAHLYYIKSKISLMLYTLKLSTGTAQVLLNEMGFTELIANIWNQMPSEIRYYGTAFGIPDGINIISNCTATAFVLKMTRA